VSAGIAGAGADCSGTALRILGSEHRRGAPPMSTNDNIADRLLTNLGMDAPVPDSVSRRQANYERMAARADTGVDPEYISAFENFHGMEHAEIHRLAQSISPVAMTTLATEWAALGTSFGSTMSWGTLMIRRLLMDHWGGAAGEAATEAALRFGESAQRLSDAARATSEKLRIAADVGERVRVSVPPPEDSAASLLLHTLDPVAGAEAARRAEAVRAQAIRVMESLYKPYYRDSGSAVPVLPSPFAATTDRAGERFTPTGYAPSDGATATGAGGDGTVAGAASGHPASTDDTGNTVDRMVDGTGQPSEADAPGTTTGTDPASTTPTSTSARSALPGGDATGRPYGSPIPAAGSGSPGQGLPGAAGSGPYGAGSSLSGSSPVAAPLLGGGPAGTGPGANPATAGSAARGTGVRPMGMMPGAVAPASGRDEQDKRAASYLVDDDNGNELIGSIPPTAPPVLGVDPA